MQTQSQLGANETGENRTLKLIYVKNGYARVRTESQSRSYLMALAASEVGKWQRCRIENASGAIVYAAG